MNPTSRALAAAAVALAYLAFCAFIAWRERRRRGAASRDAAALDHADASAAPVLVAFASQTGFAEQLAWQSARLLHTAGVPVRLLPLGELRPDELARTERALFIVSTYGEGDAPDAASAFARHMADGGQPLPRLHHAVLALGDRSYAQFCAFGRRLDGWLQVQGATPLFERIELDNEDAAALKQWQQQVAHLAGTVDLPDWQAPGFDDWRLVARHVLNDGSSAAPVCHLELEPADGTPLPAWQAGDLVQVQAPADPQRPREYTIASVPSAGRLHLMVRQERHADGSLGVASGWLTAQLQPGDRVPLRLRAHGSFRIGDNAARPLVLIGNGTGLAGLRAHLMARAAQPAPAACWLLFGERQAAHDAHYAADTERWRADGVLAQVDRVFSRDQPARRHVQHRVLEEAERLRDWVAGGAAIYVCGSLAGMAAGVDDALAQVLGAAQLAALADAGRYRRDVY
ncbi:NADPH cytochrome P450 oxidoreductase family protein [Rhizobacter sp. SG703]|uniref:NADPH cytochrome P450 oxidoreductase family protein n=1 Tax=Rhizobacter sp. SG703 TaxID=2587140 RepID=UPI001447A805|nr:NADPH cytochrome P450 oxidoreductase family protein [Rhizobacter sp. SG703]NKI94450.1 sulfite reductase (NADPH) flavoprotein alpha-component [Rhizobacter sp. SG703]